MFRNCSRNKMHRRSRGVLLPKCFLFLLTSSICYFVSGQVELTYPTWVPEYFQYTNTSNHRSDVCDQYTKASRGDINLNQALSGLKLSLLIHKNPHFQPIPPDYAIDPFEDGLTLTLLQEIAKRANFTFETSFAVSDPAQAFTGEYEQKSYTDLLLWGVRNFDVYAGSWSRSVTRLKLGVTYPEGWNDGSLIMVGKKVKESEKEERTKIKWLSWKEPFDIKVWLTIVATLLISGLIYQLLEYGFDGSGFNWLRREPVQNLFLSFMAGVGQFSYEPNKSASKVFTWSFAFWTFIMTSTYTANLASFFVVNNSGDIVINNIDDAIRQGMSLCVWKGVFDEEFVRSKYPNARLVPKPSEDEVYKGLGLTSKEGGCNLAISAKSTFDNMKNSGKFNADCSLIQVGRTIVFAKAGFAMLADSGNKCTTLIRDVFNLYSVELKNEGFIQDRWDKFVKSHGTSDCDQIEEDGDAGGDDEAVTLGLNEMAGTFVLHAVLTVIALVYAFFGNKYEHQQQLEQDPSLQLHANSPSNSPSKMTINGADREQSSTVIAGIPDENLMLQMKQIQKQVSHIIDRVNNTRGR